MKLLTLIATSALLLLASCASAPSVTDSWRDPQASDFRMRKTLVFASSSEESFRRVAEDVLVRDLGPQNATPSYSVLAASDFADPKTAAQAARAKGFESALVMRVVEVDKLEQHVPAAYSPIFLHFSDQNNSTAFYWPTRFDEGYTYMEKTYRVETNLYSLADDKLIWSGVVRVRDPGSVRELAEENSEAVRKELRAQKLLD
ncbi:MAG: hypothetical protein IPJ19_19190 [Planctomycetes bacterium]|nr:hypothetical protein [Planctomycetota bacterium]